MSNQRAVTFAAAVLLSISCLAPSLRAADTDGVMMQDGKMMVMKDGKATGPMPDSMSMSNGATVMGDGTVKMKDGTETHMKDGQMMMMDGHTMEGGKSDMMGNSTGGMSH
jgi:hypothetical protein